ncbi:hypothetical protein, partial [Micromonospora sp. LOL_024]|uniref:hypothetical protein n=1 Tax=Micromonospora sp. LOL_024 TaxID=3345412 RepID=UPI003A8C551A
HSPQNKIRPKRTFADYSGALDSTGDDESEMFGGSLKKYIEHNKTRSGEQYPVLAPDPDVPSVVQIEGAHFCHLSLLDRVSRPRYGDVADRRSMLFVLSVPRLVDQRCVRLFLKWENHQESTLDLVKLASPTSAAQDCQRSIAERTSMSRERLTDER